jgi:nucleoside 2-deoxyribosyltransferase
MKIYLAARFSRRDELIQRKEALESFGFVVTSRWLTDHYAEWVSIDPTTVAPEERGRWAMGDLSDIEECQCLIHFTGNAEIGYSTGGRHTEMGYALALGKQIIVCGPRENIFCDLDFHHPNVQWIPDWTQIAHALARASARSM